MKTFYIEEGDKHRFSLSNVKIKDDNFKIYTDLKKVRNIKKAINKLLKNEVTNVVLSKKLYDNKEFINALNSNNIKIFDGRWLERYLSFEILDYVIKTIELKREETDIAITTNEIADTSIEIIKTLARQYKRVTVVTNHIDKLRKIEREIYEENGILIVVSNNEKKSLTRSRIILNLDFNKEVLNKYKINESAIIINLEGDMKIYSKRFNGTNVNDYEIEVGREECIWRENIKNFKTKDLLEARLYMKDTFKHIRSKIAKNKVSIKELFGENGKIERFS